MGRIGTSAQSSMIIAHYRNSYSMAIDTEAYMTRNRIAEGLSLIALALIFYVAFVSSRLVALLLRKDLLELKWQSKDSYWHARTMHGLDRRQYLKPS